MSLFRIGFLFVCSFSSFFLSIVALAYQFLLQFSLGFGGPVHCLLSLASHCRIHPHLNHPQIHRMHLLLPIASNPERLILIIINLYISLASSLILDVIVTDVLSARSTVAVASLLHIIGYALYFYVSVSLALLGWFY